MCFRVRGIRSIFTVLSKKQSRLTAFYSGVIKLRCYWKCQALAICIRLLSKRYIFASIPLCAIIPLPLFLTVWKQLSQFLHVYKRSLAVARLTDGFICKLFEPCNRVTVFLQEIFLHQPTTNPVTIVRQKATVENCGWSGWNQPLQPLFQLIACL